MDAVAANRLAEAVRERRIRLRLTQDAAARAAGVSTPTWRAVEGGQRDSLRPATARGVSEALRWTPDSVDRVLAGGTPTDDVQAAFLEVGESIGMMSGGTEVRVARLANDINQLRADLADLRAIVQEQARVLREELLFERDELTDAEQSPATPPEPEGPEAGRKGS